VKIVTGGLGKLLPCSYSGKKAHACVTVMPRLLLPFSAEKAFLRAIVSGKAITSGSEYFGSNRNVD
jgi:hypothetical protein